LGRDIDLGDLPSAFKSHLRVIDGSECNEQTIYIKDWRTSEITSIIKLFEDTIVRKLPQFWVSVINPAPSELGAYEEIFIAPWPVDPNRCRLSVFYRVDCFEISFWVNETRGPAEAQILINGDLSGAVEATVDYLREIVLGHILVDVVQYRSFLFRRYYLAFFRAASRRASKRTVETLNWAKP
jgi:hypothetical protein